MAGADRTTSRIYISYRREERAGYAPDLYKRLSERFGEDRVFKDSDSIDPGQDFVDVKRHVESCSVMLAVIDEEWASARDPRTKERRLDNANDPLRIEIATALKNKNVLVIPVLVGRSAMPAPEDLPDDLKLLATRAAVELRETDWEADVEELIRGIERLDEEGPPLQDAPRLDPEVEVAADREKEKERERADRCRAALDRAQESLDDSRFQEAIHHAEDALELLPESTDAGELRAKALELRAKAEATREKEQRAREVMRKAQQTVKDAKGMVAEGRHDVAIAILEQFSPPHDLVTQALAETRQQFADVERQRQEAQRQRRLEAEARKREEAEQKRQLEAQRAREEARVRDEATRREDEARLFDDERKAPDEDKPLASAPRQLPPQVRPPSPAAQGAPQARQGPTQTAPRSAPGGLFGRIAAKVKEAIANLGRKEPPTVSQPHAKTSSPEEPLPLPPQVLLGVSAPSQVNVGDTFIARFVAYVEEVAAEVKQRLRDLDERTAGGVQMALGLTPSGGGRWRQGTPVKVRVSGKHISAEPSTQSFEWNGKENLVSFVMTVAEDAPKTGIQICFEAFIEGVSVAFVPVSLRVGVTAGDIATSTITARPASTAFASYASKDAPLVALCLSALKHWDPQLDVFMDCLDLTPNESWQRELERIIPTRDAFLLFWSVNAMNSKWVAWELSTAASKKGLDCVRPMPIDDPELAPPPEALKHLHFRDRYMLARQGFLQLAKQRE